MEYRFATTDEIESVMHAAGEAFQDYRKADAENKALFLDSIAREIEALGDTLILKAMEETNLPAPRLMGERDRTVMQLKMFATMVREGSWVEASIDTAMPDRVPVPRPDLRKMLIPLGPVVVFGASNFPFAFSTAGGDSASALAAGCPVIVKAHPSHSETSTLVYNAIQKAIVQCNMPEAVFQHIYGANEAGKALVQHPVTAAVGFTGSFTGGNALVAYARDRAVPIPVFSEMSSVNPVIFLPDTLEKNAATLAKTYGGSITLSMGQFCTNPGLMFGMESDALDYFLELLGEEIVSVKPARMLSASIQRSYNERMDKAVTQEGVQYRHAEVAVGELEALPGIASVSGKVFLNNQVLREEVFGPYSIMVKCKDREELKKCWSAVSGQLTTSLMGSEKDFDDYKDLIAVAEQIAGRIVFNGVPTGVEVCASMVHGGPYPATTDGRYTAVGINAVKRWVRPVCYQNCPEHLLPEALQNANPAGIVRLVNNRWTSEKV